MMIARKGVAVDTVVLLILGVIVLALIAYLIFTHFEKGQNIIVSKECLAARMDYCLTSGSFADVEKNCPGLGYKDKSTMTEEEWENLDNKYKPCEGIQL